MTRLRHKNRKSAILTYDLYNSRNITKIVDRIGIEH